ncbi:MAG: hypothetical protein Ct9H300mP32_5560 [Verrucomicrobiota bacterium]|nr:MAG: hypothetical protein Ct9H300mP32_5560 [Verrucomicrobiota bacterium]
MNSGNTYRVQPDGLSVEQFTFGQVNPFGMCLDTFGNFYTADCHSSPIYQLIRDAYYPSFGKPHDGMGFAPLVIAHNHNSTGPCGIVLTRESLAGGIPRQYFHRNVVTSRVNRDRVDWLGSSPKGPNCPTSCEPATRGSGLLICSSARTDTVYRRFLQPHHWSL